MSPPKPTNSDLMKEIKSMQTSVRHIDGRLGQLEAWKHGLDIAKAAVDEYKTQEEKDKQNKLDDELKSRAIKILVQLSPLLTVLGVLLYALAQKN